VVSVSDADQVIPCIPVEVGARHLDEFVKVLKPVFERLGHPLLSSLI